MAMNPTNIRKYPETSAEVEEKYTIPALFPAWIAVAGKIEPNNIVSIIATNPKSRTESSAVGDAPYLLM